MVKMLVTHTLKENAEQTLYSEQFRFVVSLLPSALAREIISLVTSIRGDTLEEIRVRPTGLSSLSVGGRNLPLFTSLSEGEFQRLLSRVFKDGLYAYGDTMKRGYIPLDLGIRCGVVGEISYDGGIPSGVGSISSLVFRMPILECDFAPEIARLWKETGRGGLLFVSLPLVGKTSALRALAGVLASGRDALRVAVVDERGEFYKEAFKGKTVDVMRGYKRRDGVEIAIRTMSAEVIIMDEIADGEDVIAAEYAGSTGVPIIASAHAESFEAAKKRKLLTPLFDSGIFSSLVFIQKKNGRREFCFYSLKEDALVYKSEDGRKG